MTAQHPDLVLGLCTDYELRQIEPFLASLRAHAGAAHVALFAARMDLRFYHAAERLGIDVFNAQNYLKRGIHGVMARYTMYDDYLRAMGGRFRRVLLSDLRDVLFQGDPFAEPLDAAVSFAVEDHVLGRCEHNSAWLRMVYGPAVLEELAYCPISCSGTTIGTADGIGRYVRAMRHEVETRQYDRAWGGLDQAMHNYIVWHDRPEYGRVDRAQRIVSTLSYVPPGKLRIEAGRITVEGRTTPLVHQYDRHPPLVAFVAGDPAFRLAS